MRVRSSDGLLSGARVSGAGGVVAREVLLGRRSESPSDQPDRAGPGRRHMSSQHYARRLACPDHAGGRRHVSSQPRCFVRQMTEEERSHDPARTGQPERPGDDSDE